MSIESTQNFNVEELKKSLETTNEFYKAGYDNDIQYDDKFTNIINLLKKLLNEDKYKDYAEVKPIINRLINGFLLLRSKIFNCILTF